MHVLLVVFYFPPYNTIGSIRVGKFARYLTEMGHSVSVIAARDPPLEQDDDSLRVEIAPERVTYTPWFDVNRSVRALAGSIRRIPRRAGRARPSAAVTPSLGELSGPVRGIAKLYMSVVNVPDAFWGWQRHAVRAALARAHHERPDVVLASGPPFSTFQVASRLSDALGVPWVADFRDYWSDNPYYPFLGWRRRLDRLLEKRALSNCAGIATVSPPMVEHLALRYPRVPTACVMNGFDADDFGKRVTRTQKLPLIVRYTGVISYVDDHTLSILYDALKALGEENEQVRLEFVLRDADARVVRLAEASGVGEQVSVVPPVPYRQSLELQQQSDVNLRLTPDGPEWDHAYSGKFFEYCGAGRPILTIGRPSNVAAQTVQRLGLGLASNNADQIADWLREQIQLKRTGTNSGFDRARVEPFTRKEQTARLEHFLRAIVAAGSARARVVGARRPPAS